MPDVVFAEKIVGDGIAIKPTGNKMVAPVDGTIGKIFETNHAFSIESDSGIELFVHFGIDTVELKGEGFKRIAEEGQRVKVGDPVIEFDLPLLEEKAKSTLTPVVISNMDEIKELIKLSGSVTVGETPVIRIKVILAAVKNGAFGRHFLPVLAPPSGDGAAYCLMALRLSGLQGCEHFSANPRATTARSPGESTSRASGSSSHPGHSPASCVRNRTLATRTDSRQ